MKHSYPEKYNSYIQTEGKKPLGEWVKARGRMGESELLGAQATAHHKSLGFL